jgi:cytochrome b involved in lipid metabolism
MKKTFILIASIVFIAAACNRQQENTPVIPEPVPEQNQIQQEPQQQQAQPEQQTQTENQTQTQNEAIDQNVQNQQQTQTRSYTMAQVQTANSQAKCYSVINGMVYDLTSWISNHPGGEKAILGICGKDGTLAFTQQHSGQEKPLDTIKKFYIGDLEQ